MAIPANQIFTAEVTILGSQAAAGSNSTPAINVFNFKRRTNVVNPTKAALNTVFQANIIAPLLAAANIRYTPINVSIRWIDDALDPLQFFAAAGVGAIGTDSVPSDDAVYMLLRTANRGKHYRGAKHFAAANEVDTLGDILTGAGLVRWQTLQTALAAPLVDATPNTWDLAVFSKSLSTYRTNPTNIISNPVTQVLLDLNIGTMRRRRSKTVR
jgi:hypothetical protein